MITTTLLAVAFLLMLQIGRQHRELSTARERDRSAQALRVDYERLQNTLSRDRDSYLAMLAQVRNARNSARSENAEQTGDSKSFNALLWQSPEHTRHRRYDLSVRLLKAYEHYYSTSHLPLEVQRELKSIVLLRTEESMMITAAATDLGVPLSQAARDEILGETYDEMIRNLIGDEGLTHLRDYERMNRNHGMILDHVALDLEAAGHVLTSSQKVALLHALDAGASDPAKLAEATAPLSAAQQILLQETLAGERALHELYSQYRSSTKSQR